MINALEIEVAGEILERLVMNIMIVVGYLKSFTASIQPLVGVKNDFQRKVPL